MKAARNFMKKSAKNYKPNDFLKPDNTGNSNSQNSSAIELTAFLKIF
jgi:hypothetical protein